MRVSKNQCYTAANSRMNLEARPVWKREKCMFHGLQLTILWPFSHPIKCPAGWNRASVKREKVEERNLLNPAAICQSPIYLPKSMWKTWPVVVTRMLSLWRSPMPSTYVATHQPAQDSWKFSRACNWSVIHFNCLRPPVFFNARWGVEKLKHSWWRVHKTNRDCNN